MRCSCLIRMVVCLIACITFGGHAEVNGVCIVESKITEEVAYPYSKPTSRIVNRGLAHIYEGENLVIFCEDILDIGLSILDDETVDTLYTNSGRFVLRLFEEDVVWGAYTTIDVSMVRPEIDADIADNIFYYQYSCGLECIKEVAEGVIGAVACSVSYPLRGDVYHASLPGSGYVVDRELIDGVFSFYIGNGLLDVFLEKTVDISVSCRIYDLCEIEIFSVWGFLDELNTNTFLSRCSANVRVMPGITIEFGMEWGTNKTPTIMSSISIEVELLEPTRAVSVDRSGLRRYGEVAFCHKQQSMFLQYNNNRNNRIKNADGKYVRCWEVSTSEEWKQVGKTIGKLNDLSCLDVILLSSGLDISGDDFATPHKYLIFAGKYVAEAVYSYRTLQIEVGSRDVEVRVSSPLRLYQDQPVLFSGLKLNGNTPLFSVRAYNDTSEGDDETDVALAESSENEWLVTFDEVYPGDWQGPLFIDVPDEFFLEIDSGITEHNPYIIPSGLSGILWYNDKKIRCEAVEVTQEMLDEYDALVLAKSVVFHGMINNDTIIISEVACQAELDNKVKFSNIIDFIPEIEVHEELETEGLFVIANNDVYFRIAGLAFDISNGTPLIHIENKENCVVDISEIYLNSDVAISLIDSGLKLITPIDTQLFSNTIDGLSNDRIINLYGTVYIHDTIELNQDLTLQGLSEEVHIPIRSSIQGADDFNLIIHANNEAPQLISTTKAPAFRCVAPDINFTITRISSISTLGVFIEVISDASDVTIDIKNNIYDSDISLFLRAPRCVVYAPTNPDEIRSLTEIDFVGLSELDNVVMVLVNSDVTEYIRSPLTISGTVRLVGAAYTAVPMLHSNRNLFVSGDADKISGLDSDLFIMSEDSSLYILGLSCQIYTTEEATDRFIVNVPSYASDAYIDLTRMLASPEALFKLKLLGSRSTVIFPSGKSICVITHSLSQDLVDEHDYFLVSGLLLANSIDIFGEKWFISASENKTIVDSSASFQLFGALQAEYGSNLAYFRIREDSVCKFVGGRFSSYVDLVATMWNNSVLDVSEAVIANYTLFPVEVLASFEIRFPNGYIFRDLTSSFSGGVLAPGTYFIVSDLEFDDIVFCSGRTKLIGLTHSAVQERIVLDSDVVCWLSLTSDFPILASGVKVLRSQASTMFKFVQDTDLEIVGVTLGHNDLMFESTPSAEVMIYIHSASFNRINAAFGYNASLRVDHQLRMDYDIALGVVYTPDFFERLGSDITELMIASSMTVDSILLTDSTFRANFSVRITGENELLARDNTYSITTLVDHPIPELDLSSDDAYYFHFNITKSITIDIDSLTFLKGRLFYSEKEANLGWIIYKYNIVNMVSMPEDIFVVVPSENVGLLLSLPDRQIGFVQRTSSIVDFNSIGFGRAETMFVNNTRIRLTQTALSFDVIKLDPENGGTVSWEGRRLSYQASSGQTGNVYLEPLSGYGNSNLYIKPDINYNKIRLIGVLFLNSGRFDGNDTTCLELEIVLHSVSEVLLSQAPTLSLNKSIKLTLGHIGNVDRVKVLNMYHSVPVQIEEGLLCLIQDWRPSGSLIIDIPEIYFGSSFWLEDFPLSNGVIDIRIMPLLSGNAIIAPASPDVSVFKIPQACSFIMGGEYGIEVSDNQDFMLVSGDDLVDIIYDREDLMIVSNLRHTILSEANIYIGSAVIMCGHDTTVESIFYRTPLERASSKIGLLLSGAIEQNETITLINSMYMGSYIDYSMFLASTFTTSSFHFEGGSGCRYSSKVPAENYLFVLAPTPQNGRLFRLVFSCQGMILSNNNGGDSTDINLFCVDTITALGSFATTFGSALIDVSLSDIESGGDLHFHAETLGLAMVIRVGNEHININTIYNHVRPNHIAKTTLLHRAIDIGSSIQISDPGVYFMYGLSSDPFPPLFLGPLTFVCDDILTDDNDRLASVSIDILDPMFEISTSPVYMTMAKMDVQVAAVLKINEGYDFVGSLDMRGVDFLTDLNPFLFVISDIRRLDVFMNSEFEPIRIRDNVDGDSSGLVFLSKDIEVFDSITVGSNTSFNSIQSSMVLANRFNQREIRIDDPTSPSDVINRYKIDIKTYDAWIKITPVDAVETIEMSFDNVIVEYDGTSSLIDASSPCSLDIFFGSNFEMVDTTLEIEIGADTSLYASSSFSELILSGDLDLDTHATYRGDTSIVLVSSTGVIERTAGFNCNNSLAIALLTRWGSMVPLRLNNDGLPNSILNIKLMGDNIGGRESVVVKISGRPWFNFYIDSDASLTIGPGITFTTAEDYMPYSIVTLKIMSASRAVNRRSAIHTFTLTMGAGDVFGEHRNIQLGDGLWLSMLIGANEHVFAVPCQDVNSWASKTDLSSDTGAILQILPPSEFVDIRLGQDIHDIRTGPLIRTSVGNFMVKEEFDNIEFPDTVSWISTDMIVLFQSITLSSYATIQFSSINVGSTPGFISSGDLIVKDSFIRAIGSTNSIFASNANVTLDNLLIEFFDVQTVIRAEPSSGLINDIDTNATGDRTLSLLTIIGNPDCLCWITGASPAQRRVSIRAIEIDSTWGRQFNFVSGSLRKEQTIILSTSDDAVVDANISNMYMLRGTASSGGCISLDTSAVSGVVSLRLNSSWEAVLRHGGETVGIISGASLRSGLVSDFTSSSVDLLIPLYSTLYAPEPVLISSSVKVRAITNDDPFIVGGQTFQLFAGVSTDGVSWVVEAVDNSWSSVFLFECVNVEGRPPNQLLVFDMTEAKELIPRDFSSMNFVDSASVLYPLEIRLVTPTAGRSGQAWFRVNPSSKFQVTTTQTLWGNPDGGTFDCVFWDGRVVPFEITSRNAAIILTADQQDSFESSIDIVAERTVVVGLPNSHLLFVYSEINEDEEAYSLLVDVQGVDSGGPFYTRNTSSPAFDFFIPNRMLSLSYTGRDALFRMWGSDDIANSTLNLHNCRLSARTFLIGMDDTDKQINFSNVAIGNIEDPVFLVSNGEGEGNLLINLGRSSIFIAGDGLLDSSRINAANYIIITQDTELQDTLYPNHDIFLMGVGATDKRVWIDFDDTRFGLELLGFVASATGEYPEIYVQRPTTSMVSLREISEDVYVKLSGIRVNAIQCADLSRAVLTDPPAVYCTLDLTDLPLQDSPLIITAQEANGTILFRDTAGEAKSLGLIGCAISDRISLLFSDVSVYTPVNYIFLNSGYSETKIPVDMTSNMHIELNADIRPLATSSGPLNVFMCSVGDSFSTTYAQVDSPARDWRPDIGIYSDDRSTARNYLRCRDVCFNTNGYDVTFGRVRVLYEVQILQPLIDQDVVSLFIVNDQHESRFTFTGGGTSIFAADRFDPAIWPIGALGFSAIVSTRGGKINISAHDGAWMTIGKTYKKTTVLCYSDNGGSMDLSLPEDTEIDSGSLKMTGFRSIDYENAEVYRTLTGIFAAGPHSGPVNLEFLGTVNLSTNGEGLHGFTEIDSFALGIIAAERFEHTPPTGWKLYTLLEGASMYMNVNSHEYYIHNDSPIYSIQSENTLGGIRDNTAIDQSIYAFGSIYIKRPLGVVGRMVELRQISESSFVLEDFYPDDPFPLKICRENGPEGDRGIEVGTRSLAYIDASEGSATFIVSGRISHRADKFIEPLIRINQGWFTFSITFDRVTIDRTLEQTIDLSSWWGGTLNIITPNTGYSGSIRVLPPESSVMPTSVLRRALAGTSTGVLGDLSSIETDTSDPEDNNITLTLEENKLYFFGTRLCMPKGNITDGMLTFVVYRPSDDATDATEWSEFTHACEVKGEINLIEPAAILYQVLVGGHLKMNLNLTCWEGRPPSPYRPIIDFTGVGVDPNAHIKFVCQAQESQPPKLEGLFWCNTVDIVGSYEALQAEINAMLPYSTKTFLLADRAFKFLDTIVIDQGKRVILRALSDPTSTWAEYTTLTRFSFDQFTFQMNTFVSVSRDDVAEFPTSMTDGTERKMFDNAMPILSCLFPIYTGAWDTYGGDWVLNMGTEPPAVVELCEISFPSFFRKWFLFALADLRDTRWNHPTRTHQTCVLYPDTRVSIMFNLRDDSQLLIDKENMWFYLPTNANKQVVLQIDGIGWECEITGGACSCFTEWVPGDNYSYFDYRAPLYNARIMGGSFGRYIVDNSSIREKVSVDFALDLIEDRYTKFYKVYRPHLFDSTTNYKNDTVTNNTIYNLSVSHGVVESTPVSTTAEKNVYRQHIDYFFCDIDLLLNDSNQWPVEERAGSDLALYIAGFG